MHADAHENNGQRKFQTVPAESEKSAASFGRRPSSKTYLVTSDAVNKKRVIDISGFVRMHQLDGKERDKRVSSCIEMLANIYEYYTMAWLDFFCLSMVVPHTLSRNPCLTCRTTSSWSWRQIGEMYRNDKCLFSVFLRLAYQLQCWDCNLQALVAPIFSTNPLQITSCL